MLRGTFEKVAILDGKKSITYGELAQEISQIGNLFADFKDQRVAIFSENRIEWIYAFYAVWSTGNIPVPIDYLAGSDDIAFILNDCKPELVISSEKCMPELQKALKGVMHEPRVLILDELEVADAPVHELSLSPEEGKTAVIIYTSGTTGSPKGVMLSFRNLVANLDAVSRDVPIYTTDQRVMILLPLHHIFPLLGTMIAPLYTGSTIAICPSLNATDIITTLQAHKVTLLLGVPRLYSQIHKGIIDKINQSGLAKTLFAVAGKLKWKALSKKVFKAVHQKFGGSLRFMIAGGAPLDPVVADDFNTLGFDILEGYGMTEAAPMITFTRPGKFMKGSAGQALPCAEIEVRDGEIVVRGENIMQGYYHRPEETAAVLKDNWLYTGDLGYVDAKGFIFITGRKKEIIVLSNGKNINPAEIELKIQNSSAIVKEAAVFAVKDKLNLIVVPDESFTEKNKIDNLYEYIKKEVLKPFNDSTSASKKIARLHIGIEELPKTRLSKIKRFELPAYVESIKPREEVQHEPIDSEELKTIIEFLAEQTNEEVYPEYRLIDDLALDSLSKISLIVYLENTFGVKIEEENLEKFQRVRDLSKHIIEHKTQHQHFLINWSNILKQRVHFQVPKPGISFTFSNIGYKALINSMFRFRKSGLKNIPDEPCIIAANHQSFLDGFLVAAALRRKEMKNTYIYAKEKHWRSPLRRYIARKNNVILLDINKNLMESLQKMAEVLRNGQKLIIFPEGTRSATGEMSVFKQTFAILAREMNVPVIPVAITGANTAMPVGSRMPRFFKPVSVDFLQPVYPGNLSYDSLKDKVQNVIAGQLNQNSKKSL
ncbi:MAG: AMP-binding protein [Bacteroidales bacterium]|nr:AMP-binding protein [Bacteroidales bacterium]